MSARNEAAFNERKQERINRRNQVEARTGLSRSSIYAAMAAGTFPKPIRLGALAVGWLESEIDAWLNERIAATRNPSAA
jgi:prophage regulatory protein